MTRNEGSSTFMAAVNLTKLCIGSGILAIPFSFQRGGLIFSPACIGIVAFWNGVSCCMLMRCKKVCVDEIYPDEISSAYSRISYSAFGKVGLLIANFSLIFTLLGICVSFQIAFVSLTEAIPNNIYSPHELAFISAVIVFPMCWVKDVGMLSLFSMIGLVFLVFGILSIFLFGIYLYGDEILSFQKPSTNLNIFPKSLSDTTEFLGVSIFCFGSSTLAFPVEESMKYKHEFKKALTYSLLFVWMVYAIVGDGIILLYRYDSNDIKSNILQNLPTNSLIASFLRITMAMVCLLSYPLTLLPPAQMLESVIATQIRTRIVRPISYLAISNNESNFEESHSDLSFKFKFLNRLILISCCTIFSSYIPCFGMVVSLLGCFTVSIVTFVLPPLLHLYLVTIPLIKCNNILHISNSKNVSNHTIYLLDLLKNDRINPKLQLKIDYVLAILGTSICIIATYITLIDSLKNIRNNGSC